MTNDGFIADSVTGLKFTDKLHENQFIIFWFSKCVCMAMIPTFDLWDHSTFLTKCYYLFNMIFEQN